MGAAKNDSLHLLVGNSIEDAVNQWCDEHLKGVTLCGYRLPIIIDDNMPPNEAVLTKGREAVRLRIANAPHEPAREEGSDT
jgi:hypothetical protein